MNKERLLDKIKKIKHNIAKHVLRTGIFAVSATAPTHTAGSESASVAPNTLNAVELSAENIFIAPEPVNIAQENSSHPIYEFTNKVYDSYNREVKDFANVTKYSLWDCSYKREAGNEKNPVGVAKAFYGSLQFNRFNAENMAIYGLLNPNYEKLASRFFVKKAGFDKAIEKFRESAQNYEKKFGDANLVYHVGSSARKALTNYISPNFKTIFQKEGVDNTQQFLNLQRAYASDIYCSFDAKNLKKIVSTLEKSNIKPEQVNPAIWGMFLAKNIKGGFGGISSLLEGKTIDDINSPSFINSMADKYPDVFKKGSGKDALKFAKEHYKETHSITTMKELSSILNNSDIFTQYLHFLKFNQKGSLTFAQAQELSQTFKMPDMPQMKKVKFSDLVSARADALKVKKLNLLENKKLNSKLLAKVKKSKSR